MTESLKNVFKMLILLVGQGGFRVFKGFQEESQSSRDVIYVNDNYPLFKDLQVK